MADKVAEKAAPKEPAKKEPGKKLSPMEFLRQVRQETLKVTWPTRKETLITTAMVFVMVIAASLFFLTVDYVLSHIVQFVITRGS